jgi:hypothetical protein
MSATGVSSTDEPSVLKPARDGSVSFEEFVLIMQKISTHQSGLDRLTSFKHLVAPKEVEDKFTTSELLQLRKLFAHYDMDCGMSLAHLLDSHI